MDDVDVQQERPQVGSGYSGFKWLVDAPGSKVGYGATFDVFCHTEMHKRVYWDEYDTYQAQMVVEIDSMYTMIW